MRTRTYCGRMSDLTKYLTDNNVIFFRRNQEIEIILDNRIISIFVVKVLSF